MVNAGQTRVYEAVQLLPNLGLVFSSFNAPQARPNLQGPISIVFGSSDSPISNKLFMDFRDYTGISY
ncbi:predicted protein [Botrytis cinerea T4]|uniref:Uncharacterized protein n=1 Tax=Botryotinia fuckeliana (strain T4) TaxID=999810 RepID=G2Y813_BOTF4|nr:predicted protein [Botrytis cinerea T4]